MKIDKNETTQKKTDPIVLLNKPITSRNEDIFGYQIHADSLAAAIDAGAQMIAVTSPFGAGKSSVIQLFKEQNENTRIVNISMWSHLCDNGGSKEVDTIDLHCNFLYQLVSQLAPAKGEYISRRLNKAYGLLKIHTGKKRFWILALVSLVLFIAGYIFPEVLGIGFPVLFGDAAVWNSLIMLASIICLVIVIGYAEIVFSSSKSEGSRKIEANEIIELYKKYVLKEQAGDKKLVFVIEDLDRTDKHSCVIEFLKELRKYYIQEEKKISKKDDADRDVKKDVPVVFIVNVKQESELFSEAETYKEKEHESLYAKLFDYILNIQTINIDDYETILNSMLQQNESSIRERKLDVQGSLISIPGMQWIIRGKNYGIRDIKDRLNKAFLIYDSICERFPKSPVEFEKCAVVAYLTTAFEHDFIKTDDRVFGELIEAFLQNNLTKEFCQKKLPNCSEDYIDVIMDLVGAKHIDSRYRMYFYNYPKNSSILSHDELAVQNAILYGDSVDGLDQMTVRVANNNPAVIENAFQRIKHLKLPLRDVIFKTESLYIEALRCAEQEVYEWIENLDYSQSAFEKTSTQLMSLLSFDAKRFVFNEQNARSFCDVFEKCMTEENLLKFRQKLCRNLPSEMRWYNSLFTGVHNIITITELDCIPLEDALALIDVEKDDYATRYLTYVVERYKKEDNTSVLKEDVCQFLRDSLGRFSDSELAPVLLDFMAFNCEIVPEFEDVIIHLLKSPNISKTEKDSVFKSYQEILNHLAEGCISENTFENISQINIHKGYTQHIANALYDAGYVIDSILVSLNNGDKVDFMRQNSIHEVEKHVEWLLSEKEAFQLIRWSVLKTKDINIIRQYAFLFSESCPVVTKQEFNMLKTFRDDEMAMSLIPPALVSDAEMEMLAKFFCRCFQQNTTAFKILMYISKFDPTIAKETFSMLDFDNSIKYSTFAADKKTKIKTAFWEIFELENATEKIAYMNITRFMDSVFEDELQGALESTESLGKGYIEAVNNCNNSTITATTIRCICCLSKIYALKPKVTERLFAMKKYRIYVISKMLHNRKFVLDDRERMDILWSTYMAIFTEATSESVKKYMCDNIAFLEEMMVRKAYLDFTTKTILRLTVIKQDAELITHIMTYGETFALTYFTQINGFKDATAAKTFVDLVSESKLLIKSQELYNHTHEKLINSALKAKYTNARKKKDNL